MSWETKTFKVGDTVQWESHAGGNRVVKKGKVVVAFPAFTYVELTKKDKIDMMREVEPNLPVNALKRTADYQMTETVLAQKYRLKFSVAEGYREERHYLVEVEEPGATKKLLYHPLSSKLELAK